MRLSLQKNKAIKMKKIKEGVYKVTILNVRILGEKENREQTEGNIYLIQNTKTKNLKIGFSVKNSETRLKQLQTGNESKLILLYTQTGTFKDEKSLHKKFLKFKLEGEWFKFSEKIIDQFKKHKRMKQ